MAVDLLAEELRLRAERRPYASAVVVWSRHPTSGRAGDRALVTGDGHLSGWVGGSCSEPVVIREALAALADGKPRVLHLGPADTAPGRAGVVAVPVACASEGELDVFIQPHPPPPRLVAVGRAPMLEALATMARAVGYDAAVTERGADGAVDLADLAGVGPRSAVVVATFGRYDEDALQAALGTDAAYVGLVASAKRAASVLAALREAGVPDERLARVRAPAGLDLGHLEHTEIAVAVLADVVASFARDRAAAPAATTPADAVDPVCGMTVDRSRAADRAMYEGVEYVFCCAGCRRRFEADPTAFLGHG